MPKVKETVYNTVTLSFSELETILKQALNLDKGYKLSLNYSGDVIWDYKVSVELTKTTEK